MQYAPEFIAWFDSLRGSNTTDDAKMDRNKDAIYEQWKTKNPELYKNFTLSGQLQSKYAEYNDINSPYYKNAGDSMMRRILQTQPDYLKTLSAIGMGEGSAAIASEKEKQFQASASDKVSTSMMDLYSAGQNTSLNVLGMDMQNNQNLMNYINQREQLKMQKQMMEDEKSTSLLDNILGIGGNLLTTYLTGGLSGLSGNKTNYMKPIYGNMGSYNYSGVA
jgi:hypothetical protein